MTAPDAWDQLARLPDHAAAEQVIPAARADLTRSALELRGEFDVALPFEVRETSYDAADPSLTVSIAERFECEIKASALVRAKTGLGPVDLLASALVRLWAVDPEGRRQLAALDGNWRPKRVGGALGPTEHEMELNRRLARDAELIGEVERTIEADADVIIVGRHGSGRTATAAVAARELGARRGYQEIWLNLTDPGDGPESVIAALMKLPLAENYLLVVDGLQANLPVVTSLLACVEQLRRHFPVRIRILATTLISTLDELKSGEPRFVGKTIEVSARKIIDLMADDEEINGADRQRFLRLVGTDVHIAAKAVEMFEADQRIPTAEALLEKFTGGTEEPRKRALLYRLACLGAIGQTVAEGEAIREFGPQAVRDLLAGDLIHRTDGAVTLAPRKRAQLVLSHALRHWPEICTDVPRNRPEDVVWAHLRRSDRLIRAALSELEIVNIHDDSLRPESLHLLEAWELSEELGRWLRRETDRKPDWSDNLGSAVFAAMALSRLHHNDQWLAVAEKIRSRWDYTPAGEWLPEPVGADTTDRMDFKQIAETMAVEDDTYWPETGHPSGLTADDFDADKAYRTWALGLLLCFEATAPLPERDQDRIEQLLTLAEHAVEDFEGFYPARIPWVTARVLIGISLCPIDQERHPAVRPACRWLRGLVADPGASWWRGGTGKWNSDEATTAMCIVALSEADGATHATSTAIETAIVWLASREEHWKRPGREIDLAQIIDAFVRYGGTPMREALMTLLQHTRTELRTPRNPDYDRPEERLRLPFLAAQLTDIVWRTVRSQIRVLLRDVMGEAFVLPETPPARTEEAVVRPLDARSGARPPCGLATGDLRQWEAAVARLYDTIHEGIRDRTDISTPAVAAALDQFLWWQESYYALLGRLSRTASRATLDALDVLGGQVLGRAWPRLPRPDVYCDEDAA